MHKTRKIGQNKFTAKSICRHSEIIARKNIIFALLLLWLCRACHLQLCIPFSKSYFSFLRLSGLVFYRDSIPVTRTKNKRKSKNKKSKMQVTVVCAFCRRHASPTHKRHTIHNKYPFDAFRCCLYGRMCSAVWSIDIWSMKEYEQWLHRERAKLLTKWQFLLRNEKNLQASHFASYV